MRANGHTPVRTCMACGSRAPQATLLRIVRNGAEGLRPDAERRAGGRGGYLHREPACWTRFAQRKGALRALRAAADRPERVALVGLLAREAVSE